MTPARVLTVCVGISAYPPVILQPGERPLEYLARGARLLADLFASMWPSESSRHVLLVDQAATWENARTAFGSATGPYDLRILYLGGHGRGGNRPYEFLFFGDEPQDAAATAPEIDALLELAGGDEVLLLLDSCFAGAYADETGCFGRAPLRGGRVCIASCRSNQKSWEDVHFEQSLFSHAVVKALTTLPGQTAQSKALTGEFFSEISHDVAQHAFALKASTQQEPVARAAIATVVMLTPSVAAGNSKPAMTTLQVLVRRSRQVLIGTASLAAVFLAATAFATWRPAVNQFGHVELRAGPKWLSPLNVGPWRRRVETAANASDLSNAALTAELADEAGLHAWLGSNSVKLRRWADVFVESYLNDQAAASWSIRLGFNDAVEKLATTLPAGGGGGLRVPRIRAERVPSLDGATQLAAEAKLLDPTRVLSDSWQLQWKANVVPGTCDEEAISPQMTERLRTYLSTTEPTKFSEWLRGLAITAKADDVVDLDHVAQLIEMFRAANSVWRQDYSAALGAAGEPITAERIAARFTERPSRQEQLSLRAVASALLEHRLADGRPPVTSQERARLKSLMAGCGEYAAPVLAALGTDGDVPAVLAWAHGRKTSDQGRGALRDLALRGVLPDSEIARALDVQGFDGDALSRKRAFVDTREWLGSMADVRALPLDLSNRLLDYADERLRLGDAAGARDALAVVVRSPTVSQAPLLARVQSLIASAVQPRPPLPAGEFEIELLGLLARAGAALTAANRQTLLEVLANESVSGPARVGFTDRDRGVRSGTTQLVAGATTTHLLALSRLILSEVSPNAALNERRALDFLRTALVDSIRAGANQERLREVVAATAVLTARLSRQGSAQSSIRHDLDCCADDVAARQTHVNIAIASIALMPLSQRPQVLADLRKDWRREQEPEVRLALAEVIIRSASERELWVRAANPTRR